MLQSRVRNSRTAATVAVAFFHMLRVAQRTIVKDMQLREFLLNREPLTSWAYRALRYLAGLAAIAIAATWCTGNARARDLRSEEVLTSCRPDVMRFCDHFTGRGDIDAAMFCLKDNFKSLRIECRRVMPTAAKRSGRSKPGVNSQPIVLHRE